MQVNMKFYRYKTPNKIDHRPLLQSNSECSLRICFLRIFQPAMGHSASPHADQNAMRSRLAGVGVSSAATTRPNPPPAGVSLSSSGPAGPPPGIISGIQPTTTGTPKTSGTSINRQTAHGSKLLRYTDNCFEPGYWDVFTGSCA